MKKNFLLFFLFSLFQSTNISGTSIKFTFYPAKYLLPLLKSKYLHGTAASTIGTIIIDEIAKAIINKLAEEKLLKSGKKNYLPPSSILAIIIASAYGSYLTRQPNLELKHFITQTLLTSIIPSIFQVLIRLGKEFFMLSEKKKYGLIKNLVNGVKQALLNAIAFSSSYLGTKKLKALDY